MYDFAWSWFFFCDLSLGHQVYQIVLCESKCMCLLSVWMCLWIHACLCAQLCVDVFMNPCLPLCTTVCGCDNINMYVMQDGRGLVSPKCLNDGTYQPGIICVPIKCDSYEPPEHGTVSPASAVTSGTVSTPVPCTCTCLGRFFWIFAYTDTTYEDQCKCKFEPRYSHPENLCLPALYCTVFDATAKHMFCAWNIMLNVSFFFSDPFVVAACFYHMSWWVFSTRTWQHLSYVPWYRYVWKMCEIFTYFEHPAPHTKISHCAKFPTCFAMSFSEPMDPVIYAIVYVHKQAIVLFISSCIIVHECNQQGGWCQAVQ